MRALLVCLLLAFASPVWAGPPEGEAAAAQEEELTAAPDSIDYGMIENAGADGVFESIPDGQVSVRHVGSGMVCRFEREGGRLILFPGLPRGEDVGCDHSGAGQFVTFYATRYPGGSTLESELASAVAAMQARYRQMEPRTLEVNVAPAGAVLPASRHARFLVTGPDGARMYTRVSVAIVRGWSIKMRFSALAPD
ncbi:MAG: hypothetical protein AB7T08_11205, partial [Hyphomonadaceae bacterium]